MLGSSWACQKALVCFSEELDEAAVGVVETALFGVVCDSASIADCPPGAVVSCGGALGVIDQGAIAGVCELARSPQLEVLACQNP